MVINLICSQTQCDILAALELHPQFKNLPINLDRGMFQIELDNSMLVIRDRHYCLFVDNEIIDSAFLN